MKNLENRLNEFDRDLRNLKEWKEENERWATNTKNLIAATNEKLEATNKQIEKLSEKDEKLREYLDKEIKLREEENEGLKGQLLLFDKKFTKQMTILKTLFGFISTVIVGGGGALIILWLTDHIK